MNDFPDDCYRLDRRQVRHAFDRAASEYDAAAVLQREVRGRLLERLDLMAVTPARVLDLGSGTGQATVALRQHFRKAQVVALDAAPGMARRTRERRGFRRRFSVACAEAENLPLADQSIDIIFSNLMLQWCDDLDRVFRECRRVLRSHGLLMFTTFGPDTMREVRAAWAEVDGYNHVNRFVDMHDIGDALVRAGLAEPVMDVEHLTLTYPDALSLMRDIKRIGAHNVTAGRPRGLMGRRRLRAVAEAFESWRGEDGRLPLTYEVVYGTAWNPLALPRAGEPAIREAVR
ncbi:MAG: malonyl-ACP O-methyltransferase BioC [Gammaproteobacteria bacterium]|jgi:malonyl-CoA O-methyltransferase